MECEPRTPLVGCLRPLSHSAAELNCPVHIPLRPRAWGTSGASPCRLCFGALGPHRVPWRMTMRSLSSGHPDDIHQDTGRPAAHLLGIGRRGHSPGHSHQPRKMAVSYSSIGGSGRPVPEHQLAPQNLNLARCVSPHPWGLAPLPASAPAHLGRPVYWFIQIDQARYRPLGLP